MKATLSLLAATGLACADGTATWLADVTTTDGDTLVEPGETAVITISLEMTPIDIEAAAIAAVMFDLIGDDGAAQGQVVDWEILNGLDDLVGDLTTTDGVSLFNVVAGQLVSLEGWRTCDNPAGVLAFEWAPNEFTGSVVYSSMTWRDEPYDHQVVTYEFDKFCDDQQPEAIVYPVNELFIDFDVTTCHADINADNHLNILDFVTFQLAWQAGDHIADCNADDTFDILDFVCFQSLFTQGCP